MSKLLDELKQLRKNLDKNTKRTPDYHITTKVVVDDKRYKTKNKPEKTQNSDKIAATNKVKSEIRELFQYGFDLPSHTQLSVTANTNKKYETVRFLDKFKLSDILTEFSRTANMMSFFVDTQRDTIFWNNYGVSEVRVIIQ